jgi:hypothetical protein
VPNDYHQTSRILKKLDIISGQLSYLTWLTSKEMTKVTQLDDSIAVLQQDIANETAIDQKVLKLINGISQQVQTAVQNALAAGATPDELKALSDLHTTLQSEAAALVQAVAAQDPNPPTPQP